MGKLPKIIASTLKMLMGEWEEGSVQAPVGRMLGVVGSQFWQNIL